jgi:cyclomaltodextrinase
MTIALRWTHPLSALALMLAASTPSFHAAAGPRAMDYANATDKALAPIMAAREKDWRIGAVSYQVLVDRFAPSANLEAKRSLYPAPKRLRDWSEVPKQGTYVEEAKVWSHEIDFWGGDLPSLTTKLDYIQSLGVGVLYLNPIHLAYTNHKYDALDYQKVSPEYGSRDDVKKLAAQLHSKGMKLVLDGVFNHMGRNSPMFQDALAAYQSEVQGSAIKRSPYRDWFVFGPQYPGGARVWWGAQNLPELNLENPAVRKHVFAAPDSVVRSYLRDGVDGWRLDVAFDIGFTVLSQLTHAAHKEKPGSLVLGEIANYPQDWFPSVDGVLGFTLRRIVIGIANGQINATQGATLLQRMIADAGIENMLRSWNYLDNHDTPRLATALPNPEQRQLALVLQFALPGSPNLYYGTELGMTGGDDPEMRAPMRWDWVNDANPTLAFTRKLISLHRQHRALRLGNYNPIPSQHLLAFERRTDRAAETVIALINPSDTEREETLLIPNSKMMDGTRLTDLLGGPEQRLHSALLHVKMPPRSAKLLTPNLEPHQGYSNYKRVH